MQYSIIIYYQRTLLDGNRRKGSVKFVVGRRKRRSLDVDLGAVDLGVGVGRHNDWIGLDCL